MSKQEFIIRNRDGFAKVSGYVTEDGKFGIDKRFGKVWYITDIPTGLAIDNNTYKTRKDAVADIERLEALCKARKLRETAGYKDAVTKLNEFKGIKTESEDKTMAKTNKSAKANTKAKANEPNETARLEGENVALRKEIELLKAQIEALQPKAEKPKANATKPSKKTTPKATIDTFDVDKYLETRDNKARITAELIEAIENTEGLSIEWHGAGNKVVKKYSGTEWMHVKGDTEDDTRSRRELFKKMGFRFTKSGTWMLAPHPLRGGKAWAAKKARAVA